MNIAVRSIAAIILLSVMTVVCSCDDSYVQNQLDKYAGNETTSSANTSTAATTTVVTPIPTVTPTENIADPIDNSEGQYHVIMDGIAELEAESPDTYLYMIKYLHDDQNNYDYWGVSVTTGNRFYLYVISEGQFTEVEFGGYSVRSNIDCYFSYDDISRMPFLTNSPFFVDHGSFVDEIEDGTYYGEIIAISGDRDYGFFHIGTIVGTDTYPLPVTENDVFVILPIAEDYVVTDDQYSFCLTDAQNANWESQERTGDPMFDSRFWYYREHSAFSEPARYDDMGWYDLGTSCYVFPVNVCDGVVTSINLEWR